MKKFLSLTLALVMCLTACSALAETARNLTSSIPM